MAKVIWASIVRLLPAASRGRGTPSMVRPIRRIVAGNDDTWQSGGVERRSRRRMCSPIRRGRGLHRRGYGSTDRSPARVKGIRETLHGPQTLAPPAAVRSAAISNCRQSEAISERSGPADVRAWFERIGSPEASTAKTRVRRIPTCSVRRHSTSVTCSKARSCWCSTPPRSRSRQGDVAILNGANHAWSNRSDANAIVILSQHSGVAEMASPAAGVAARCRFRRRRRMCAKNSAAWSRARMRRGARASSPMGAHPISSAVRPARGSTRCGRSTTCRRRSSAIVDRGGAGRSIMHSPPAAGANWRISFSPADVVPVHGTPPARRARGRDGYRRRHRAAPGGSGMHRTPSVDYAICLQGDRKLVLEDSEVVMNKGDVVIQLGNWHTWAKASDGPNMMSYRHDRRRVWIAQVAVIVPSPLAGEGMYELSSRRDWVRGSIRRKRFAKRPPHPI